MIRRWIIRALFLLTLAFVVAAWVTSYFGGIVAITSFGGRFWAVGAVQGLGFTAEGSSSSVVSGFHFGGGTADELVPTILGFGWGEESDPFSTDPPYLERVFPLWLLTAVLTLLSWFVWRKTRARYNGRGFPVERIEPSESPAKSE